MSDIPRYRPVSNDMYGITDDVDGKLCEYRDYARLQAEVERLTAADSYLQDANEHAFEKRCDELEAEVERLTKELSNISGWGRGLESDLSHARVEISFLKAEVERLEQQVQYWKIEAECDHGRWLRTLEDLEHLRKLK